jgi:hypothetical protein
MQLNQKQILILTFSQKCFQSFQNVDIPGFFSFKKPKRIFTCLLVFRFELVPTDTLLFVRQLFFSVGDHSIGFQNEITVHFKSKDTLVGMTQHHQLREILPEVRENVPHISIIMQQCIL